VVVRGAVDRIVVESEEIVPTFGRSIRQLEAIARPDRFGGQLEYALQQRDDGRRILEPLLLVIHGTPAKARGNVRVEGRAEDTAIGGRHESGLIQRPRELLGALPEILV